MRNWHHNIIKLDSALNKLGNNYLPTVVAISEEIVQFEILQANGNWVDPPNYKAMHPSFDDINGIRKIILRNYFVNSGDSNHDSSSLTKSSLFKDDSNDFSFHAIAVTGIISGNDIGNNTKGISAKSTVISTQNIFNAPLIAKINDKSSNNLQGNYKQFYVLPERKVVMPSVYNENFLPYESWSASVINQSQFFTIPEIGDFLNYSNSLDFILQELFAYGRDGRGVLYVCASGNGRPEENNPVPQAIEINDGNFIQAKSNKSLVVGASYINLNENDYSALSTGYLNGSVIIPESVAQYSNYGNRLDIVAPSSPNGNLRSDEVGIYAPSPIKGGDFGVADEELLIKRIINISSNKKVITLNNVYGVFKGQTIEIGDDTTFLHEFKTISSVDYVTNEISFKEKLKFTKNLYDSVDFNVTTIEVKITVLKLALGDRIDSNKYKINSRIGIMKPLNDPNKIKFQKVFVYNKDEAENRIDINSTNNNPKVRMINEVRSIQKSNSGGYYIIEFYKAVPNFTDLFIIPDQMEIKVETFKSGDSVYFGCKTDYFLDGFFIGQKIKIDDFMTNITFINYEARSFETKHFNVQEGSSYTIYSLAYGSFLNSFGGTSAAAPIISGVSSLVISANNILNASEIKHILKTTADQIGNVNYDDAPSDSTKYNYGYTIHEKYGTGRVNAEAAVQLAKDWHDPTKYGTTVLKPRLEIADKLNGTTIVSVPTSDPVDSPDIWVSKLANSNTIPVVPFNQVDTSKKQYINVKVRNTGNRNSFKESDLRVFVAFTDDATPAFPFPTMWYNQTDVKLLTVKEIPIISPGGEAIIQVEWNDIAANWNKWNPIVGSTGKRKRAYILAHIAPFDGLPTDVQPNDIRNNKQLTCKEIIVTHNGVSDRTAYLPGNNLNLTVGTEVVTKSFDFTMENILSTGITGFKIKATKMNNDTNHTIEEAFFKKTGNNWAFEIPPSSDWIAFGITEESVGNHPDYTNLKFPHTIKVNDNLVKVKLEIVNI